MNGEDVDSKDLEWQQRFTELEAIIVKQLNRGKSICIAESLLRLLDRLFEKLDCQLRLQQTQYQAKKSQIQAETIPNLSKFTDEQYQLCEHNLKQSIATSLTKTANCVNSHRRKQKMWEELQSSINSYFDTLETTIRQSSSTYSNELLKSLKSRIDLYINRYQSIVKDISAQQAKEAAQIDEMQKAIDTDTREIKDRKKRLSERRYKLAAIDVKF